LSLSPSFTLPHSIDISVGSESLQLPV
jgi:hypothetical protein